MEDEIEKDPMAAHPPDENVVFQTGDSVIDQWERELAQGGTPDIEAAFAGNPEVEAWLKPKKKQGTPNGPPELDPTELEFSDDFTKG